MLTSKPMGTPQDRMRSIMHTALVHRVLHLFLDEDSQSVRHPEESGLKFQLIPGTVRSSLKGRCGGLGDRKYRIVTAYFKDEAGRLWSVVGKGDLSQWPARCFLPKEQERVKQKVRYLVSQTQQGVSKAA